MTEWKTIESAPVGKEILLYEPDYVAGRDVLTARIVSGYWPTTYPRKATHWMPLPSPPKET